MLHARSCGLWPLVPALLFLALPLDTSAQTAQFSSAANFGTVAIGQTSAPITLTVTFSGSVTIGSVAALTQGAPNLDFAVTSAGTCKADQSYSTGNTCTVVATLTPQFAGLRSGAIVLQDNSGNTFATGYLRGIGSGPQAAFAPGPYGARSYPFIGVFPLKGVAVDGAGNIFVGSSPNQYNYVIDEIPSGCAESTCVKQLGGSFLAPFGVALDGAGNVFVADSTASGQISEILASSGYSAVKIISGNFGNPRSLTVDGSGNIFLTGSSIVEIPSAGGYSTATSVAGGFQSPSGIAVDSSGNLYVSDQSNFHAGVFEILAVNGSIPASPTINSLGSGILYPTDVTVDASGNVFFTDSLVNHSGLFEIPAAGGYTTVQPVFTGLTAPFGLTMDGGGNFYVVDDSAYGDYLNVIPRAASPGLAFQTPTPPGSSDTADGPLTTTLENIGNAPLTLSALAPSSANFTLDSGTTTCTATTTLAPGSTCNAGVRFTPTASGANITGNLIVTDNSGNAIGSTQPVPLAGASLIIPAVTITPSPNPVAVTQPLTVTVTVNGGVGKPTPTGMIALNEAGSVTVDMPLTNGSATFNIAAGVLPSGSDFFSARYTPDAVSSNVYFTSTALASVTVTTTAMVQPTVSVIPAFPHTPVTVPLTLTANVAGGAGNPTPTGTVTFSSGSYTSSPFPLTNGIASIVVSAGTLAIGTDQFQVVYTPDAASSAKYIGAGIASWVTVSAAPPPVSPPTPGFGTLPIGQTSALTPITLTFGANATIGSVTALTQGAPGLDFAISPGGTCVAGATFSAGQTCTVNATFSPKFAGERNGGIVLRDGQGNTLTDAYVHGTGTGPQLIFMQEPYAGYGGFLVNSNSSSTTIGTGFNHPNVAVDGAGNVFVADAGNFDIKEIPAGCTDVSCQVVVMTGLNTPLGIAVDGAGNLFVTELGFSDVRKIPLGCQTISCTQVLGGGFNQPYGLAIDANGNVFVADTFNNSVEEILAAGGYSTTNTLNGNLDEPWSVVVDPAGNLFVAEGGDVCQGGFVPGSCLTINTSLVEIPAAGGYATVNTVAGNNVFGKPLGLAIDGSGNVYEGDFGDSCSDEFTVASAYATGMRLCSTSGIIAPEGVAVQGNGNIYLPDVLSGAVVKLDFVDQSPLNFRTPAQVGQTDSVDGSQYFGVQNNGNAPLTFTAFTLSDPSFQIDTNGTTCLTSKPLAPGSFCLVGVIFEPIATGLHNATLTLTDNNLNQASSTQVFPLSADAIAPAPVILTNPANPTTLTSATFTFSDTQANVTFVCSIDSLPFGACVSGVVYPSLPGGPHSFQVKAVDTLGHLSLAAVYNWTVSSAVKVTAPVITSGPADNTNESAATFTFTDTEPGVSFLCSLDGASFSACTSGINYSIAIPLTALNFYHTFVVEAMDSASNISQPTSYAWIITRDPIVAYSVDLGTVPVGQTSAPQTVTFNFTKFNQVPAGDLVATISATTLGVTGLDFAVSNPGTCAVGTAITSTTVCTMQVTFSPKLAGRRKGGVVLVDAAGNEIAEAYLEGIGTAPELTFTPYSTVALNVLPAQNNANPGLDLTTTVTDSDIDGAGNVYVTDLTINSVDGTISQSTGDIWKFPVGCTSAACNIHVASDPANGSAKVAGLLLPEGLAIDGEGTLWGGNLELDPVEFTTVGNTPTTWCEFGNDFFGQLQLQPAVDGAGAVSFVGTGVLSICQQELGNVGNPIIIFSGQTRGSNGGSFDFSTTANSLAVDPQGNIFVADAGNNAVKEVLVSSNYTISQVVGSGFNNPISVASDSFGNIFVADKGSNTIKEMTASSGYTTILTIASFNLNTGSSNSNNIKVDAHGNVYVPNQTASANGLGQLVKLDFADAPALNFPTATKVATTDSTDGTLTATVKNNGNAPLTISGLALPGNNFQIDASATTCSANATLAAGASCTVGVFFAPTAVGSLTGTLTLTDNALNANAATQQFALSGTGYITPITSVPTVVVTPGASTITTAQTLSVTVTVTGKNPTPVPTGAVTLSSGTYNSAAVTLSGGTATFTVPAGVLATGSDTLTAIYEPDQAASITYSDSSGTAPVTVTAVTSKSTPTVTVTPSPSSVSFAQNVAVTVTVAGSGANPTPSGSVTLVSGSYSSGAVNMSNGVAAISIPARTLPVGTDTLTANYAPDFASTSNYNNATGSNSVAVQALAKTPPAVTVTPSPSTISTTQGLNVTIALQGGLGNPAPTGSVTLTSGSYSSGPLTESNGSVTVAIPAGSLATGADTLTASYTPDSTSAQTFSAASGTGVVTVNALTTQTIIFTQPASPVVYTSGLTIPLVATGGASGNPVIFTLDASSTGAGSVSGSTLTVTGVGTFVIDANQAGNSNYSAATQVQRTIIVTQIPQAINFTQPTTPVNFSSGLTIPLVAAGGASGNPVVFTRDASSTATGSITGNTLTVTGVGTFVIDANQTGAANYSASPQVQRTVVVAQAPQTINFTQPTTPVTFSAGLTIPLVATGGASGNPVVFTLDASSTGAGSVSGSTLTVTGIGTFVIDANQAGNTNYLAAAQVQKTIVVTSLIAQTIIFTQPASPVVYSSGLTIPLVASGGASGNAIVFTLDGSSTGAGSVSSSTLTVTGVGTFVIDANQAGNANYSAAAQVQRTVIVTQVLQTINFTQPTTPVTFSTGLTITLVAAGGASGNPVVFTRDASSTATGSISGSTLTVTSAGNLVIDANQAGNANYSAAPQVQKTIVVNAPAPDFSVSVTSGTQTVAAGASGQYTVSVTDVGGAFTSAVALSVSGLPTGITGTFNPTSITPGSTSGTSTLTVQVPIGFVAMNRSSNSSSGLRLASISAFGGLLSILLLLPLQRARKRWRNLLLALFAIVALGTTAALTGCGGGFGMTNTAQTYTLTITGTSSSEVSHSTTVQLTVP